MNSWNIRDIVKNYVSPSRKQVLFIFILFLILFGVMFFFYYHLALNIQYSSDAAAPLLEGKSIVQGNILLKGWTLSTVSYYTNEIPMFAIGIILFGFSDRVIYLVTALNYSLLASIMIFISAINDNGLFSFRKAFIATIFSFFLASLFYRWTMYSPIHLVAYFYCFGCIFCIYKMQQVKGWEYFIVYALLLALSSVGDTFSIYIVGLPIVITCFIRLFGTQPRKKYILLLITTTIAILASRIILKCIELNGGFFVPPINTRLVEFSFLGRNFALIFAGLLDLFNINLLDHPLSSWEIAKSIIHISGLVVFLSALIKTLKNFNKQSLVIQVITMAIIMNLLEYTFGNVAANRSTVRYLVPSLMFGVVLISKNIYENAELKKHLKQTAFILLIIGASLLPPLSFSRPALPINQLSAFLMDKNLVNGYGPFWCAPITTTYTSGKVTIHSVMSDANGKIGPFHWLSQTNEYNDYANFLVLDNDENEEKFKITMETAISTFGKPDKVYIIDDRFTVLTWDYNISNSLSPGAAFWENAGNNQK